MYHLFSLWVGIFTEACKKWRIINKTHMDMCYYIFKNLSVILFSLFSLPKLKEFNIFFFSFKIVYFFSVNKGNKYLYFMLLCIKSDDWPTL